MAVASPPKPAPRKTAAPTLRGLLNVPNFLTLCRVGSYPVFLSFLSRHQYTEALYVFVAAALTDALDGTVALSYNARTASAAFLDPFADKLRLVAASVVLTGEQDLPG